MGAPVSANPGGWTPGRDGGVAWHIWPRVDGINYPFSHLPQKWRMRAKPGTRKSPQKIEKPISKLIPLPSMLSRRSMVIGNLEANLLFTSMMA